MHLRSSVVAFSEKRCGIRMRTRTVTIVSLVQKLVLMLNGVDEGKRAGVDDL